MHALTLDNLQKIIHLVRSGEMRARYRGLVEIEEHPAGGLVLLNYTGQCQYAKAWDEVTVWRRGLILDTATWEAAAIPLLDKEEPNWCKHLLASR